MREESDVCIIGGGLAGILCALEASNVGLSVCMIDKNFSKSGDHAPSVLFALGEGEKSIQMLNYAGKQWHDLASSLEDPLGLNETGVAFFALTEQRLSEMRSLAEQNDNLTLHTTPEEMANCLNVPTVQPDVMGVLVDKSGASIFSNMAQETVRRELIKKGVRIWGSDVVSEFITQDSKVIGVKTKHDEIYTKNTILCGGVWTSSLIKQLGLNLPIRPARSHRIEISTTGDMPPQALVYQLETGNIIIRKMVSGRTLITYTGTMDQAQATWSRHIDYGAVDAVMAKVSKLLPAIAYGKITNIETHTLGITPDMLPYLGRVASVDGLYVVAGMNSHSFAYATGAAKSIALLLQGGETEVDMEPFNPDRFILKDVEQAAAEGKIEKPKHDEEIVEELKDFNPEEIEKKAEKAAAAHQEAKEKENMVVEGKELVDKSGKVEYSKIDDKDKT